MVESLRKKERERCFPFQRKSWREKRARRIRGKFCPRGRNVEGTWKATNENTNEITSFALCSKITKTSNNNNSNNNNNNNNNFDWFGELHF